MPLFREKNRRIQVTKWRVTYLAVRPVVFSGAGGRGGRVSLDVGEFGFALDVNDRCSAFAGAR